MKQYHTGMNTIKHYINLVCIRWSSLKKRLSLSKQRISPFIQSHSATITRDLQEFGTQAKDLRSSFLNSNCLLYQSDYIQAQSTISQYGKDLLSLQVQAKDLMELQELLQSAVVNFNILKQYISLL